MLDRPRAGAQNPRMSTSVAPRILILWTVAALGCSDASPDAGEPDEPREPAPYAPSVAEYSEPAPLAVADWRVASVFGFDPVREQLFDGPFSFPDLGMQDGLFWQAVDAPGGVLGTWPGSYVYAVARVTLDEPARIIARTDRTYDVFQNGALQPGDVYGSGRMRVPLLGAAGDNVIVVRGRPNQEISVDLWTTTDELYANLEDPTVPDLVEGDTSELYVGVPVLNMTGQAITNVEARIVESEYFHGSVLWRPAMAPASVTQLAFRLLPKGPYPAAGETDPVTVPVTVHVRAPSLGFAYERQVDLSVVAAGATYRRTFLSPDDGSTQYYGVVPPAGYDPAQPYGLILSLHGAGVEGIGQAAAYSQKDWAFVVAPTNRRPFGFDWEEWGHKNAIFALDDAMAHFDIDPTRVHLTGHSMGGHGAWSVGVTRPGRFAVIAPSAGWESFYTYVGTPRPSYPLSRARAHSDTLAYLGNLARRGVYVLHGELDDNVPVSQGRAMSVAAATVSNDVVYFEQPGAGHWWDGDASPGADCVDWPPMMEMMEDRRLDPSELDFEFRSPSPAYTATHSFVTLESAESPMDDLVVASEASGSTVALTTSNVRSMTIDGAALVALGIEEIVVDGEPHAVPAADLAIGPTEGKRRQVYGTYNQVFHRPFCYVYPDGSAAYARYAAYLVSYWAIIGNGQACALPLSALTPHVRDLVNLVYLGVPSADLGSPDSPFEWSEDEVRLEKTGYDAGLMFVFPEGDRLAALLAAPAGRESLLYSIVPFSSRAGLPDYLIRADGGDIAAGFFDADWRYDPSLRVP